MAFLEEDKEIELYFFFYHLFKYFLRRITWTDIFSASRKGMECQLLGKSKILNKSRRINVKKW